MFDYEEGSFHGSQSTALQRKYNVKRCLLPLTRARRDSKAIKCFHSSEHVPAMMLLAEAKKEMTRWALGGGMTYELWSTDI